MVSGGLSSPTSFFRNGKNELNVGKCFDSILEFNSKFSFEIARVKMKEMPHYCLLKN